MAPLHNQPAASETNVPTLSSTGSDKRSASYTSPDDKNKHSSPKPLGGGKIDVRIREYHNSIKATLTALLNDERVRQNPGGSKCVQSVLLETERDLRKEKRKSLGTCPSDEKA